MVCPVASNQIKPRGTEQSDLVVGLNGFLVGKGRFCSLHQGDLGHEHVQCIEQIKNVVDLVCSLNFSGHGLDQVFSDCACIELRKCWREAMNFSMA